MAPEDATFSSSLNLVDDENYDNLVDVGELDNDNNNDNFYNGAGDSGELDDNKNNNYYDDIGNYGEIDGTDQFGQQILRQAREDERMRGRHGNGDGDGYGSGGALESANQRRSAFRKARTHPGVFERLGRDTEIGEGDLQGERVRKRRRNESGKLNAGWNNDDDNGNEVVVSGDSDASVSAVRKPREWGRKGRRGNEWLRAIKMDDVDADAHGSVLPGYRDHVNVNGVAGEESMMQNDWSALDADDLMATIEDSPLSKKGSRQSTPLALKLENTSLDKIRQWEMTDDLTFGSLITSTPAVPSRGKEWKNTMLDDIKRMEIENVKEMAITKSQLNKIRETSPEEERERFPRPSESRLSKHQQGQTWKNRRRSKQEEQKQNTNGDMQTTTTTSGNIPNYSQSPKEESHIPVSPIMVYKYSQASSEVDRETHAKAHLKSPKSNSRRQHDSHNLLRKLARATSNSPSPGATLPVGYGAHLQNPQRIEEIEIKNSIKSVPADRNTKKRSPLAKVTATVESAFKSVLATPMKDMPEHNQQDQNMNERTSQPNATNQMVIAKTPIVTGAWVDTPAPYRSGPTYLPTSTPDPVHDVTGQPENFMDENDEKKRHVLHPSDERKYPKSALAAVIEKVKGAKYKDDGNALANLAEVDHKNGYEYNQELDHLGDSTIQSLEDLISPLDDEQDTGTLTKLDEDTLRSLQLPAEPPRTRAEKQRYQELVTLKEMQSRLDAARTSIRDAGRSIKRVEQQVETRDNGGGRCSKCGCPGSGSGARGFMIGNPWPAIKGFLTTSTTAGSSGQERRRLTLLGWVVVPLLCWYVSEVILRYDYVITNSCYVYILLTNHHQQPFLRSSTLRSPHGRLWRRPFGPTSAVYYNNAPNSAMVLALASTFIACEVACAAMYDGNVWISGRSGVDWRWCCWIRCWLWHWRWNCRWFGYLAVDRSGDTHLYGWFRCSLCR